MIIVALEIPPLSTTNSTGILSFFTDVTGLLSFLFFKIMFCACMGEFSHSTEV